MIFLKNIYLLLLTILISVSCVHQPRGIEREFRHAAYSPRYASGFEILTDERGNTLLRVTRPWQGEAIVEQSLAIFRDKSEAEGYMGQHIVGRAEHVVCMSSSHVAMLDAIGCIEGVVGVSGKHYILNEHIASSEQIRDVGYDSNLDYEALLLLDADVVLMYGVTAENRAVTAKLKELGIPYIYLGDYVEQSPLGKAEWMVAVAEITGRREIGEKQFNAIATSYNSTAQRIAEHTATATRPQVMINTPYRDAWVLPSENNYMARIISDAGGRCYSTEGDGNTSKPIDIEQALLYAESADFWLNVGSCHTLQELTSQNPRFANVKVVEERKVYNNTARSTAPVGSDFWESGVVRPDLILKDLATIFHPEIMGEEHTLYYYTRLN
mgnify:CR=1 FL=1